MGNRLSKIVTRTGDDGTTGLGDGSRVRKDDARIAAIGEVDELNSHIGVLLCETLPDDVRAALTAIQHDLFDLGGELCMPGHTIVTDAHLERLDGWLAEYNATLPPLKEFILPGGSRAAALAHVCRTVCRRAERLIVTLGAAQDASAAGSAGVAAAPLAQTPRRYVNRLSDLMFVLARVLNRAAGGADVLWRHDRGAASGESSDESGGEPDSE
ncbi:Cobalamin adenosyltransferase [Paraburkholderia caffeinitolerans]|uniref:Cobalamin adenosyltransferase n=1 Tax=Paraburkholderia caffeinitolerans TaxID=1723730 RepID=A0A6J5FE61_9BURK|nr:MULTISPECIES: cob(I)yrinic acid a,c-diamide adenosyltransferase [Paraburkholderia]CAB3775680.1 Cobalamin adenosyltransferase [Paraburkholderia caffeinitolerans]